MTIGSYLCNRMGSPYISAVMEHNSIVAYGGKKYQSIKMRCMTMTGLKCNVTSCASNAQYQCCRPDIQVAGLDAEDCCETCCASFENKSAAKNNAIRHDVPNHALQVNCNVFTCVHYSDGLCEADSICVDSENQETKDKNQTLCETFRKRDCGCPV